MSCENSTRAYCTQVGRQIAPALGVTPEAARDLLLQVHELTITRVEQAQQEDLPPHAALKRRATEQAALEATVDIFKSMQAITPGLPVPAHGDINPAYGFVLPKQATQHGWLGVQEVCRAVQTGMQQKQDPAALRRALSPLAQSILAAQTRERVQAPAGTLSSLQMAAQAGITLDGPSTTPTAPNTSISQPDVSTATRNNAASPSKQSTTTLCSDCGTPLDAPTHRCQPAWLADCRPEEIMLAQNALRVLPILDLANRTRRLGIGTQGESERHRLWQIADMLNNLPQPEDDTEQTPSRLVEAAKAFCDNPYRNVGDFTSMLALAASIEKCTQCGRFVGGQGHDCPVQLAMLPTDQHVRIWIRDLANHEVVQQATRGRAFPTWATSTAQQPMWANDELASRFEDFDDPDESDDEDLDAYDDEYQPQAASRDAHQEWTPRWLDNIPALLQAIHQAQQKGLDVPVAIARAAEACTIRPTTYHSRQLINMIASLADGQRPYVEDLPRATTMAAWRALDIAPNLEELANGRIRFRNHAVLQAALDAAASQFARFPSNDQILADALIDYQDQPARYAADLAAVLCEAANIPQCLLCGQFTGHGIHTCTSSRNNGKVYNHSGYDGQGFNRRGFTYDGFNKDDRTEHGYDRKGLDADAYNRRGYNKDGFHISGYNDAGYNKEHFDKDGFDEKGYNAQKLDGDGFDENGYDLQQRDRIGFDAQGVAADGSIHPFFVADAQGFYGDGFNNDGFDRDGFDGKDLDLWGYNRDGWSEVFYNRYGYDKKGLNSQRFDTGGWAAGLDSSGFDRVGYNARGLNAQGYTWTGYDKDGNDRQGTPRRTTKSPKTGRFLPARYNKSGWDQFGYDAFGYHKETGLTAPDPQGHQFNYCGWRYDAQTKRCINPQNSQEWVPHQGFSFVPSGQHYEVSTKSWQDTKGYVAPGQRYAPPLPPNDPFTAPTFEAFKAGRSSNTEIKTRYQKILAGKTQSTVAERWRKSEQRAIEDPKAAIHGIPLRCPLCGRFIGAEAHSCTISDVYKVVVFTSGVARVNNALGIILRTPHNPNYIPDIVTGKGTGIQTGYRYDYDKRMWKDPDGYSFEGYNDAGLDIDGHSKEGFTPAGFDRDGFNRRGYTAEGLDIDGNTRPLSLDIVAGGLDEGVDRINNKHIADVFSRSITTLVGKPRRVVFGPPGSGFATDMKGLIKADPQPLPSYATTAQQLVAIKAGVYHEAGHEEETPMDLWASILEMHMSSQSVTQELDLGFAGLGVQTVGLDAARAFVKDAYNIVEDGRMERRMSDRYSGVEALLAADAQINPRWSQTVMTADGKAYPAKDVVPWALLNTALPFFNVRPSVRAKMEPSTRALFEELEPVIAAAVRGTPENTWSAAVYMAARFEQAGLVMPSDLKATQPGNPPPGTAPRRPRIVIQGDQIIDASSAGQGRGESPFDVEFTGHVTVRGQMSGNTDSEGGQTIFSGGITFEDSQPPESQGQSDQQGTDQNQGNQQSGGQQAQSDQQQGGQGQKGQQSDQQQGGQGQGGEQVQSNQQQGGQGQSGQQSGQQQGGQGQGDGQAQSNQQQDGQNGGASGGGRQYQPTGADTTTAPEDDTNGRGKGWRRGLGQNEQDPAPKNSSGVGETNAGKPQPSSQNNDQSSSGNGTSGTNASDVVDADMEDYWRGWNDDSAAGATGTLPSGEAANSSGAGARGTAPQRQGGKPYRDADEPFTRADVANVLAATEREAVQALDVGIRTETRVEALGAALHRPLGNRDSQRQRFKTVEDRVEAAMVGMPRAAATTTQRWAARRSEHKKVAAKMASVLAAIRADVDKRLRSLPQGSLDRQRMVRAVAGQQNVHTTVKTLPKTAFRASVSVDLSASMKSHILSGSLYDSMMVLGDCFELLDIPYEARGFGSTDAQFKAMEESTFNAERAAALTETSLGGTSLANTASLAMTSLRGGEETNRLFIALSDGDLGDQEKTAAILKHARRHGIVTFGIFLGAGADTQRMDELYGPGNWTQINVLDEMPKAVGQRLAALFNRLAQR